MKIVCDENLHLDSVKFPAGTTVLKVNGREITQHQLNDADALLVRSVTPVDRALLDGTAIRFVGTATSGTDHLDKDYLDSQGIRWCSAPGSNADAVADYCIASIGYWLHKNSFESSKLSELSVGIVGAGQVGSRLARRLSSAGCQVLLCDPPLAAETGEVVGQQFVDLVRIQECDIVSLHVPFIQSGAYPTASLIGSDFLQPLDGRRLLINSCRGEVLDESALLAAIKTNPELSVVIDVWRGEPDVNAILVDAALIATPHIAGYSQLAKRSAAHMVAQDLFDFFALNSSGANIQNETGLDAEGLELNDSIWDTVLQAFDIAALSANFKDCVAHGMSVEAFDVMRKNLSARREFRELEISQTDLEGENRALLSALGFRDTTVDT